jgi:deoxyadenosine/deoxycytidine kinase
MSTDKIDSLQMEWVNTVHRPGGQGEAPLITIAGPSGAGKSTIVTNFSQVYPTFIETTEGNPHLQALLTGGSTFDAAGNQRWFLESIGNAIEHSDPERPLILDQDPGAIVLVYGRMFYDEGLIHETEYTALLKDLIDLEELMRRWKAPRRIACLDAPAEVLRTRVEARWGESRTPESSWFIKVRGYFHEFSLRFPNALLLSTIDLSEMETQTIICKTFFHTMLD